MLFRQQLRRQSTGQARRSATKVVEPMIIDGQAFHPRFVRENLRDAKSWDSSSRQRLVFGVSPHIRGTVEQQQQHHQHNHQSGPSFVQCRFDDGSVGPFPVPSGSAGDISTAPRKPWPQDKEAFLKKLRENALDFGAMEAFKVSDFNNDLNLASEGLVQKLPATEQSALQAWIEALNRDGVAIVKNMPTQPGELKNFAERLFGYALPTAYGQTFTIQARSDPNNLAYSSLGLQLHTDLPYYQVPPPIQLFHCIQQAHTGGGNIFADGIGAAEKLRATEPELFARLAARPVQFQDSTPTWELHAEHPTIELSKGGEVSRVHFNERARDSWHQWQRSDDLEETDKFYLALSKYEELLEDPKEALRITLEPGEMSVIDNWRLLHSRDAFAGERWLEGGYITWEQAHSLWRVLSAQRAA